MEKIKTTKRTYFCFTCEKKFKTLKEMEKHLKTKKHKQAIIKNKGKGIL